MGDDSKNKLNSFVKFIIGKIDKKDLPDIQKNYDELMEYFDKFYIISNEKFESITNELEETQKKNIEYKSQQEIYSDKINKMMAELANNMDLNQRYKKLNEDYNKLNQKYNVCTNENAENQMKLKNNEKLINDLQGEISNVKRENFEKFEKITELEKAQKKKIKRN